jgi:hypothetical protein
VVEASHCKRQRISAGLGSDHMDTNTLLIIVVLVLLLGGGGFYFNRRGA